jgi:ribosomal protein S18 acetylase RimI-like enzyme
MAAEGLLPPRRELPALDIRRVCDETTRLAFCDVGSVCFNVPIHWFREIFLWDPVWEKGFQGWVAYRNGEPVATAATVMACGVAGIYNVATLPTHRRLGCAEAVMRHALEHTRAATGCERTILQSTEQGLRLYESMGYRAVTKVVVYATG